MKRLCITFSGAAYDESTCILVNNASHLGADQVLVYDDVWVTQQDFYSRNQWLWKHPQKRGFGWYAWKPFIIMDALERFAASDDIVLYVDADTYPVQSLHSLYRQADVDNIMLFRAGQHLNYKWCKRDAFIVMGVDTPFFHNPTLSAGVARFMLFKKGPWITKQFLAEWLTYCINPLATTFDPSILGPEVEGFVEHRTEQAIMTLLAYKYALTLHPEADSEMRIFVQDNPRPPEVSVTTAAICGGSRFRNV